MVTTVRGLNSQLSPFTLTADAEYSLRTVVGRCVGHAGDAAVRGWSSSW